MIKYKKKNLIILINNIFLNFLYIISKIKDIFLIVIIPNLKNDKIVYKYFFYRTNSMVHTMYLFIYYFVCVCVCVCVFLYMCVLLLFKINIFMCIRYSNSHK